MSSKEIHVLQLYPKDMNIYGDTGNVLAVTRRIEWYGYTPILHSYNPGDAFPEEVDIVLGGGGQDSGQDKIQEDLQRIAPRLRDLTESDTPMLMICGLYQLFGHFFETKDGARIDGIGILDVETFGREERLIGNIITHSEEFGDIVGYENHSGQTYLGPKAAPLAQVQLGAGNNSEDSYEGARYRNVIGSYLHGALLPKNPLITDFLIRNAAINRYGELAAMPIDDRLAERARAQAMKRPR
jgi:CobQ-like glutamine amidotransferase family enzyme